MTVKFKKNPPIKILAKALNVYIFCMHVMYVYQFNGEMWHYTEVLVKFLVFLHTYVATYTTYDQCYQPPGHPFAYKSAFFEEFAPNFHTLSPGKEHIFLLQIIII